MVFFKNYGFNMVKKFLLFNLLCFFAFNLSAIDYEEFIDMVLQNNRDYQKAMLEHKIKSRAVKNLKYRWLPQIFLGFDYQTNIGIKTKRQVHSFSSTATVRQNLPFGMNATVGVDNTFALAKIQGIKNDYSASGNLNFSMPLYFFAPSALKAFSYYELELSKLHAQAIDLALLRTKEKLIAEAVYIFVSYYLSSETAKIEEKKIELNSQIELSDEILWRQGRLSTAELSERNAHRFNEQLNFLKLKKTHLYMKQDLNKLGLPETSVPDNIDTWLTKMEDYIRHTYRNSDTEFLLREKQLKLNIYYQVQEKFTQQPFLIFSCAVNPASKTKGGDTFTETIKNYWKAEKQWLFSFNLKINIPVSPFDSAYSLNKDIQDLLKLNELETVTLIEAHKNKKNLHEINLAILNDTCTLTKNNVSILEKRMEISEVLLKQGNISSIDLELQRLDYRLAKTYHRKARLDYIMEVLKY